MKSNTNTTATVLEMATVLKNDISELCKEPGSSANMLHAATLFGRAHTLSQLVLNLQLKDERIRQELVAITSLLDVMPWNANIFLREEQLQFTGIHAVDFFATRSSFFGGLQLAGAALTAARNLSGKAA